MNEVLYQFELDKKYIEEYPLETTEGTKKMIKTYHINAVSSRNAYINNKIEEYNDLKDKVYQEMQKRVDNLTPTDTSNNYININNQIKLYEQIIKYNNNINNVYEKLDFDKIITEMGDIDVTDLSEVNDLIKQVLDIFASANIPININEFNYSMFTYLYMNTYFQSMNTDSFNDNMKTIFDQIYWECPNIINHLKLNIRYLYNKYKKQLELYFINLNNNLLINNNTDINTYMNNYINLCNIFDNTKETDSYLLSYRFLNRELSIYDYLDDTPQVRKHFNRFLFDKDFNDLDDKAKEDFFIEIKNLKNVVVELNNYNLYKEFINDVVTRYKNKDTYKGIYQSKLKELEKEEKERINLMNQYNNQKGFLFFKKKNNKDLIKVQVSEQIKKIDNLYNELDDAQINEYILNNFNETSTIIDSLNLFNSYYNYFKKTYQKQDPENKELDFINEHNKLSNYVNNINNNFIKKVKFIDETDINEIIFDKYKLLNINISKDDLIDNIKGLEESIDFINLRHNLSKSNISIDIIKFIIDFKKINKN